MAPPPNEGKPQKGWLPTIVVLVGLLVLDFSPVVTVINQEALGGFGGFVAQEMFKQYIDKTVHSGVFIPAEEEPVVIEAIELLRAVGNLTGSPLEAGRASLRLGEILSRHLNDWEEALTAFIQADRLLDTAETRYHVGRCYIELSQYELAAEYLRESLKRSAVPEDDPLEMSYFHSCLAPLELAKLVFGPTNRDHVIESAKRLVQNQEGDSKLIADGLGKFTVCPASMSQSIELYRALADWNLPKERKGSTEPKPPLNKKERKKRSKDGAVAKKTIRAFLDFVEKSELKKLTTSLSRYQSNTVLQKGTLPSWLDGGMIENPNSQPLRSDKIINNLVYPQETGFPGIGQIHEAVPVQLDDANEGILQSNIGSEYQQWHGGYVRLNLFDGLFSRIEAIEAAVNSGCSKQRELIHSYSYFIDVHKKKIISLLENDHRSVLTAAEYLRESLKRSAVPEDDPLEMSYFHSCLAPLELAKLVFGPTNRDHVIESAKRLVQNQEGDSKLIADGLGKFTVCPASMSQSIELYRALADWNLPKERKGSTEPKPPLNKKERKKRSKDGAVAKKTIRAFLDFVEKSELKKLTTSLSRYQSNTVLQKGTLPSWLDGGMIENPNSQPLRSDKIINNLVYPQETGFPGIGQIHEAVPVQLDDANEGILQSNIGSEYQQWHGGYVRLNLFDGLFSRIEAIEAAVNSGCSKQRELIHSYSYFIDVHKKKIISLLENDHRSVLTVWKAHNNELKTLCVYD
eukprot:TRINITY_DN7636_c0_g1_i1.p1 TRINITY_DN7636_c0_g1~~TRINITY_DN7636_c0_g1_i1.p1  ORF type:complete len:743 (+),score=127.44 TRINITY_DN7636_c0_g1_i1:104-2332(+)